MDDDYPEDRIADLDPHGAEARRGMKSSSGGNRIGALLYLALMVGGFLWGAYDFNEYQNGTPTTATVTQCTLGGRGGHCEGTWSIGGASYTGNIKHGRLFVAPSAGSTLDVHANGGTAYTAGASLPGFGVAALLGGPAFVALIWWFLQRRPAGRPPGTSY